jgi:hypothetical protein
MWLNLILILLCRFSSEEIIDPMNKRLSDLMIMLLEVNNSKLYWR